MSTAIRFLGVAGYEVVGPESRIVIDPFISESNAIVGTALAIEPPDVILVTHAAYDHLGDAAEIARETGTPVVCGGDVRLHLLERGVPDEQIRATIWGVVVRVGGVVVRPVECHHWSMGTLSNGQAVSGTPLAFMVETEPGVRIYHYGDTSIFDMRLLGELYRPTVGIFGCTTPFELPDEAAGDLLTGEMTPDEAALAAEMLQVRVAIASHYLSRHRDVDEFLDLVAKRDTTGDRIALAPEVGQTIQIETQAGHLDARILDE